MLKGKKYKNLKKISIFYDEMNIRRRSGNFKFEEEPFGKNVRSIGKNYHEVLLLMKILQNRPGVKSMKIKYYDLF